MLRQRRAGANLVAATARPTAGRAPKATDVWTAAVDAWMSEAGLAKVVFAIPPTSAASERVFALLKNMFGDDQLQSLGDYIETSLMLAYNERKVG